MSLTYRWMVVLACVGGAFPALSQAVPEDYYNADKVHSFLDEMNLQRLTDETFVTGPQSRHYIAQLLYEIDTLKLNPRQRDELRFHRLNFARDRAAEQRPVPERWITPPVPVLERYKGTDLFYAHTGSTTVTVNPVIGLQWFSNDNGVNWQRRVGGDFQGYIGPVGVYGSVRDVYELRPLTGDSVLSPGEGALYKNGREFSESRGGITFGWEGGYVGLVRDQVRWGYGYYGTNIFDINTPPFAQLKLHLHPVKWFKFDYFHGWLQSGVVDSNSISQIGNVTRFEYHPKYIAANMLSFRPLRSTWVSIGNSIVYAGSRVEPVFLVPLMFYKSADHYVYNLNNRAGGNAQMFAALSVRPLPKVHLYSTLFVDEVSFRRMFDASEHTNWFSIKSGVRVANLPRNVTFTFEHTRTNPMVYKHFIATTDFDNSGYSMGHYLRDNAKEIIFSIDYKPVWWFTGRLLYQYAEKGPDYVDDRTIRDPNTGKAYVLGLPYISNAIWSQSRYSMSLLFHPLNRLTMKAEVHRIIRHERSMKAYQVPYYSGNNTTFAAGINYGF